MQTVFSQLSILYIFLFVGWLIGRLKKDKAEHSDLLSVLLVNAFLPCKIFQTFARNITVKSLSEKFYFPLAGLTLVLITIAVGLFASKLLTKNKYERKVYLYSFTIANYAYLGYVLVGAVFGDAFLSDFMLFAVPFNFYTYTVGYILLTGGKFSWRKLVNPITVAILLGITVGLTGIKLPEVVLGVTSAAAACVGPLSMILTGMILSTFTFRELLSGKTAYIFTFIRLVGIPALAYLVCQIAHLDTLLPMILIVTCMPCGLNTVVFPKLVGEDCKPGARLALITHVLSLATLPLWLSLIV